MQRRDPGHTGTSAPPRRSRVLRWGPVLLVVLLLAAAVGARQTSWSPAFLAPAPEAAPATAQSPLLPDPPAPAPVAEAVLPGALDPAAVRAAVGQGLRDEDLGPHVVAEVADLVGSEPVLTAGRGPVVPASTTKLLTGVAVLSLLPPETRFRTRVVTGARPGQLVLVGGGDPLLASEPVGPGAYPERADVVTLAERTAQALAADQIAGTRPRVRLRYDTSLFTGPDDNPHWRPDYVGDQIVSRIVPLWVDGGRDDSGWGRVEDPALSAAQRFAEALRESGVQVIGTPRPAVADQTAEEVAAVESAPLDQLVQQMVEVSDNETAEVLAHHAGLAASGEGSFAAGSVAVADALTGLGLDVSGDRIHDGSGLSRKNLISARTLLETVRLAASPEHPELRAVVEGLPVAGFSGSLTTRFVEGPPAGPGRVRAKTGTLTGVHALAGLVTDAGGDVMAFVLAADRVPADRSLDAREALDRVAAGLAGCRCGTAETAGGSGTGG